jgi:O-antigen ligase
LEQVEPKQLNTSKIPNKWDNIIQYMFLLSMSWLIFYSPFVRGMYFESEQRPAIIYTLFIFLLFWIYKWIKGEPTRFFRNKLDIALFALVAMYGLSFFWAVSKHDAIFEWLKYCMYFSVYYIISDIADMDKKKNVILWSILLAGLGLSIIGLDGMLGSKLGDFLNQYLKLPNSEQGIFFGTFVGDRINSTLQYPNSLAIYLIVCFFISLILSDNIKKIYLKAILFISSYILLITILFTQSKGGILVFLVGIALFYIFTKKDKKPYLFFKLIIGLIAGIFTFLKFYSEINVLKESVPLFIKNISIILTIALILFLIIKLIYTKTRVLNNKIVLSFFSKYIYVFILFLLIPIFYILNSNILEPIILEYTDSVNNRTFSKTIVSEKNQEYTLRIKLGNTVAEPEKSILLRVFSYNKNQLVASGNTEIVNKIYKLSVIEKGIYFKTVEDTEKIAIHIDVQEKDTKIVFNSINIESNSRIDENTELLLKNKYLSDSLYDKYKFLFLNRSTLSRSVFYKDGFKIIKRSPMLGSGGNAWKYLYQKYQSYGYWSSQAHNYPLQLTIETGLIGLLMFLGLIIIMVINFIKNIQYEISRYIFLTAFIIIVHSIIDFDLSLSSIMIILWVLFSLYSTNVNIRKEIVNNKSIYTKLKVPVIIICVIFINTFPIKQSFAQKYATNASQYLKENNLNAAVSSMDRAKRIDKYKPHYYIDYANLLLMQEHITQSVLESTKENINIAENLANEDFELLNKILTYNITKIGNIEKSIEILDKLQKLRPHWDYTWELSYAWYWEIIKYNIENGLDFQNVLEISLVKLDDLKGTMLDSISPVKFNRNTMYIIQKMIYLNENDYSFIDAERLVFYSIDIDIDSNDIPDQWYDFSNLSYEKRINKYTFQNTDSYIRSQKLHLNSKTKYALIIKSDILFDNYIYINSVLKKQKIEKKNGVYTIEFETGDIEKKHTYLYVYYNNDDFISFENIYIFQEY